MIHYISFYLYKYSITQPMATITHDYFQLTRDYKSKYGERTIVLLQVGAFFEVYGLKNTKTGEITHSNISEFSQICQLNISEKNITMDKCPIMMAGFRDYTLEKYLQKLSESGYTAVVYVQEKDGKTVKRVLQGVYSAGTNLSYDTDSNQQISNNIMCIWVEKFKAIRNTTNDTFVCGVAVANIFTGKSAIFEYQSAYYLNPTTFDELERCISTHCPSEIIINSTTLDDQVLNTILQFSGARASLTHRNSQASSQSEIINRCSQQKYIHHILATFFGEESAQVCGEFHTYNIATQAFCYLLHFIQEHNPNLVRKIELPLFSNSSKNLILANHTLKQLNIIDDSSVDGKQTGQFSSVLAFLNKCCSPMGKRAFQQQLIHPTCDIEWLNQEYRITELFLLPANLPLIPVFRKYLGELRDIEKICRQLLAKKLYPASVFHLYKSVELIEQMSVCLAESGEIREYLAQGSPLGKNIEGLAMSILQYINRYLVIAKCANCQTMQVFEENIIRQGISKDLDTLIEQYNENLDNFNKIREWLNSLMRNAETTSSATETEYIKIHTTEKSGNTLQITKKRAAALKTIIRGISDQTVSLAGGLFFAVSDIKFSSASTSADEIELPCLDKICRSLLNLKDKINEKIAAAYLEFLGNFETDCLSDIEYLAKYVAKMDVLQCKSYIAQTYNYCKPQIVQQSSSFVDAKQLRHVLIEHLQKNEIYVANDIHLGDLGASGPWPGPVLCPLPGTPHTPHLGILLYGTNAVGKTSLIRALGIAVIMAQSGLYVPCSQFVYSPYTAIFSRILGVDNLFKGLSTFAVEMSELRMILRNADNTSLVLGDELCSGTETESALSIFMAGLMDLHRKQSSFIFATHFHEIINFDEMRDLGKLALKHMAVHYDRELDCLVYDRLLRDGPGNRMYGLEVCKSLYLPEDFLERAYQIRTKYYPTARGELARPTTTYNSNKIRGVCEMCKTEIGDEIHHLEPQKAANANGFIGSFHKNHPANLMSLCEKCHATCHSMSNLTTDQPASPPKKVARKKTTKGYLVKENEVMQKHQVGEEY
uniref:DNA mismatch repair proteins mutS family domain-containing protein n=1 Tax=viral metagenome TaxID=1070528 RepID=A0A6C0HHS0_9ZZZZ